MYALSTKLKQMTVNNDFFSDNFIAKNCNRTAILNKLFVVTNATLVHRF